MRGLKRGVPGTEEAPSVRKHPPRHLDAVQDIPTTRRLAARVAQLESELRTLQQLRAPEMPRGITWVRTHSCTVRVGMQMSAWGIHRDGSTESMHLIALSAHSATAEAAGF